MHAFVCMSLYVCLCTYVFIKSVGTTELHYSMNWYYRTSLQHELVLQNLTAARIDTTELHYSTNWYAHSMYVLKTVFDIIAHLHYLLLSLLICSKVITQTGL